jgi:hypothetical protein
MKIFLGLLTFILPLAASPWKPRLEARQQDQATCPTQYRIEYNYAPTVFVQPVEVVTSLTANTTLSLEPFNVAITVTDAPTLLSTVVIAYSTSIITSVRQYVTFTTNYPGTIVSTTTISNSPATITILVLIPGSNTAFSSLPSATPLSVDISLSAGVSLPLAVSLPSGASLSPSITSPTPSSAAQIGSSIELPPLFTTIISFYTGSTTLTETLAAPNSLLGQLGTVLIQVPSSAAIPLLSSLVLPQQFTTITSIYTGSITLTGTLALPTLGQLGTIIVQVPEHFTTISSFYTGSALATSTIAIPSAIDQTGTILVQVPLPFTTITLLNPISGVSVPVTSTLTAPTAIGQTGTILVQIPPNFITLTSLNPIAGASSPITLTIASPTGADQTGTVVVQIPQPYTTITSFVAGVSLIVASTSVVPTVLGQTGTVILFIPLPTTPITPASSPIVGLSSTPSAIVLSPTPSAVVLSPTPTPIISYTSPIVVISSAIASASATNLCGIQGSSFDGACLSTLPAACQSLSSTTLLGVIIDQVSLALCQVALGVFGTVDALGCFTGSLVSSLTGLNVLTCIQAHVPMCATCLYALPDLCTVIGSTTSIVGIESLAPCQAALGSLGTGVGSLCFTIGAVLSTLTGQNVLNCLQQNIPLCPTTTGVIPTSLIATITTTGCGGTPTPWPCMTSLPSVCQPSGSGLLGVAAGVVDILACRTALGVFGTVDAAVCFTNALLNTLTGLDFDLCLNNHLPLCNRCVPALPSACSPTSGFLGAVCQSALGQFGDVIAAPCFLAGTLGSTVSTGLVSCLNQVLPFCTTLSTITQTSGSVAFTSTTTVVYGGLLGIGATTSTYVLVNSPTPSTVLSTAVVTFLGFTGFTSTITGIAGPGLLNPGTLTTYVLVGVPTVLNTVTRVSGSLAPYTSTVTSDLGIGLGITIFVEVGLPTPAPGLPSVLATATTTFIGAVGFTSTVTSTDFGLLGIGASTTTFVLIGVPTVLSTITISSGSLAASTATITSVIGLGPGVTTFVQVVVPTLPPILSTSLTTIIGSIGFTSTVTSTNSGALGLGVSTTTYVLVAVPPVLSTYTTTLGTSAPSTSTVTSILGLGLGTTTFVQVFVPTPLPTSVRTSGSVGFTSTITAFTTVPSALLQPATTRPVSTYVLVNVPTAVPP